MLSIHKVSTRYKALHETDNSTKVNIAGLMQSLDTRYNYSVIRTLTENCGQLPGDDEYKISFMLEQLDKVCEHETRQTAINYTNLICEKVNLLKHAHNVANTIKGYASAIKAKITGKSTSDQNKARKAAGMDELHRTSGGKIVSNDTKRVDKAKKDSKEKNKIHKEIGNDHVKMECCEMILEAVNECVNYDRVWRTHNRINERYNTKKIFEHYYPDTRECVKEFCMLLDTYDIPFRAKINICLENIAYEFDKNRKKLDKSELAEAVTEYFLMRSSTYGRDQIIEEASTDSLIAKMIKTGERLAKSSNDTLSSIGKKTVSVLKSVGSNLAKAGTVLLDLVGTLLSGIIVLLGIVILGVAIATFLIGSIVLVIGILIGVITIMVGAGVGVIISPSLRNKWRESLKKSKQSKVVKKNKKLSKALDRLNAVITEKASNSALAEAYCECEFLSAKCDIEHVLTVNKFYSKDDIKKAMNLVAEPETGPVFKFNMQDQILGLTEDNKSAISSKSTAADKMKELLHAPNKTASFITNKIKDMYVDSAENVIKEMPNIFAILVDVFIIGGAFAISPLLGIVAGMAMWFINMKASREASIKYVKQFKKEKEKAEKRGSKLSGKAKERNDAYIQELTKSISKLEEYRDSLHTDEENEEREAKENPTDGIDDDFSLDDGDDFKIEAATNLLLMDYAIGILERWNLAENVYQYLVSKEMNPSIGRYIITEGYTSGLLNGTKLKRVLEEVEMNNKRDFKKWNMARAGIKLIDEGNINRHLMRRAGAAINIELVMNEMAIGNQITMLIDKVKRGASNLSDKEKVASRTLDSSLESMRQSMENAFKQENREAVIRGQILPSASRIIKLALVSGFTFLISPALTVIYLLGVFALSKGIRAKERQLVLDEIDTELKVCKEYIEEAKNKKDMDAYRQCLQIEKKLLRQRDKLNYKMKIEYDERVPDQVGSH